MAAVDKRRRRKRARLDYSSSSDSDSDDTSGSPRAAASPDADESSDTNKSDGEELHDLSRSESDDDSEPDTTPAHSHTEPASGRELRHKAPAVSNDEFSQYFLEMVTEQFGEDLEQLRKAKDFGPESLGQLIAGLKAGVNIFSPEQQRILLQDRTDSS